MNTGDTKIMTCIVCPMGCRLEVKKIADGSSPECFSITGNSCTRGPQYAVKEITDPTRVLTCTVAVIGGVRPLVAAKSKTDIPRDMQLECMEVIKRTAVKAPVRAGDVLCRDILRTGSDIIACEDNAAKK